MTEPVIGGRGWSFRPIAGSRAHEKVIDQITFAIRSGAYRVGERLPSVEELASELHVSKPVIGEALRVLSADGVVETRRGVHGGVTVTSDNIPRTLMGIATGNREAGLRELLEARRPIEMEIARLAAHRASEEDFESMRESIERLDAHRNSHGFDRLYYDYLFHYAMGRAAQSDLLAYYQHQILEQLVMLMHDYLTQEEDVDIVLNLHERTLKAIQSGSERGINKVMDEHLRMFENAVIERVPSVGLEHTTMQQAPAPHSNRAPLG